MKNIILICLCLAICAFAAEDKPLVVGDKAPVFSKFDITQNKRIATRLWTDSTLAYIVSFGASFCVPCKQELPMLEKLSQEYKTQGLRMIWILAEDQFGDKQKAFIASTQYQGIVIHDDAGVLRRRFQTGATLPMTYFVDRRGVIQVIRMGYEAGDEINLRKEIIRLLQ